MKFIKLDIDGKELAADSKKHVSLILPDLQIQVDIRKPKPRKEYAACLEQLGKIDLFDHKDWRFGTVKELFNLCDHTRFDPALDPDLFPHTPAAFHWSSTPDPDPDYSESQFGVLFFYGDSYIYLRDYTGFVLPVRSLAAPASQ